MIKMKNFRENYTMERVKKFDEEIRKMYENEFLNAEILGIFFAIFGNILIIIPLEYNDENGIVFLCTIMLLCYSIIYYMRPYLVVEENTIYEKLKWMPITRKEIQTTRMIYLNRRCTILFLIGMVLHQIVPLCSGTFGIRSIMEVVVVYLGVWVSGVLEIYLVK